MRFVAFFFGGMLVAFHAIVYKKRKLLQHINHRIFFFVFHSEVFFVGNGKVAVRVGMGSGLSNIILTKNLLNIIPDIKTYAEGICLRNNCLSVRIIEIMTVIWS